MTEAPIESGSGEVHVAPRRTGIRHFDAIVSIAAIFISALSLYVAIEHGRTERALVAANVWPFPRLILSSGYDDKDSIAIGASNGGVGPAKIRSLEIFYRGEAVSSGQDLLRKCCGLPVNAQEAKAALPGGFSYSIIDQTVLRPGESNPVLLVHRSSVAPNIPDHLARALPDLTFRICYCSILDQCWHNDLRSTQTVPVNECPAPEHAFVPDGQ